MKKKIITFLCAMAFLAVAIPAQAQLRFGVKGGLNITSVHFDSDLLKSDNVTGFHIGPMIEATMPLLGFGFDAAILYSQKGTNSKVKNSDSERIFIPKSLAFCALLPASVPIMT